MGKLKLILRRSCLAVVAIVLMAQSTVPLASAATYPYPTSDMTGYKFMQRDICITSSLSSSSYPVAAIAQQWNNAAGMALDFDPTCNYSSTSSIVVGTFSNPNQPCLYFTNINEAIPYEDGSVMKYFWLKDVGVYINTGISGCVSTAQRRSHQVAAGIGHALGLSELYTSGYANRVMCTCSLDTVRSPSSAEGYKVNTIYSGYYGGK